MIPYVNEWSDWLRLVVIAWCLACLVKLLLSYKKNHKDWNTKSLDLWYSLFMWCMAGASLAIQGLLYNFDLTPGFVFVIAASLVSLKGLARRGEWGGTNS